MAIYDNEKLPNRIRNLPKDFQKFAKYVKISPNMILHILPWMAEFWGGRPPDGSRACSGRERLCHTGRILVCRACGRWRCVPSACKWISTVNIVRMTIWYVLAWVPSIGADVWMAIGPMDGNWSNGSDKPRYHLVAPGAEPMKNSSK